MDSKISALPDGGAIQSADELVIARAGDNCRIVFPSLDKIVAAAATAAGWSNNSHKITNLADGVAASDAAAVGQLPVVPVSSIFSRTGAVVAAPGDYRLDQIGAATIDYSLNSHKITNLANGTAAQDAAAFGQIPTSVFASGATTSGTPGTTVADLAAAATFQLVGLSIVAAQTNAASTQLTVTVTYSDSTTTTLTSPAAAFASYAGNQGGIAQINSGAGLTTFSAKAITEVKVVTAGTGTGTRSASISALQIPV